jgi:hypothetical protein
VITQCRAVHRSPLPRRIDKVRPPLRPPALRLAEIPECFSDVGRWPQQAADGACLQQKWPEDLPASRTSGFSSTTLKTRTFWPVASVTSARSVSLDNVRVSANARNCRPLILPTEKMLANTLGDHLREHGVLWHVIQFYVTGAAMKQVLRAVALTTRRTCT